MGNVVLHYDKRTGDWHTDHNGHHYMIEHGSVGYNVHRDDEGIYTHMFAETLKLAREYIACDK